MSLEDFIPFYDYFVGDEKPNGAASDDDVSFSTWIFGKSEKPAPVLSEQKISPETLTLSDNYAHAIEEVLKVYGPEDAEKILQRININLCLTPFLATLIFLSFTFLAKTLYKHGRPFLVKLAAFILDTMQDDGTKLNEIETRMNYLENMITNNLMIQQNECVEELKKKTGQLIESHEQALRSTHSRLCDLTNTLHDLIQGAIPMRRFKSDELMDPEQSGDSSKQTNFKN